MLSCQNEKHLQKIPSLDAKCIMLNLEDGVSKEEKPKALALCIKYLELYKDLDKMFVVRINSIEEGGLNEIKSLNNSKFDALRIPKIKTKEDVEIVHGVLNKIIDIHLSIETAEAWMNLNTLKISPRVTTFYLGVLDLFADIKIPHSTIDIENPTMHYILSHFLITTRSIGAKAVSFVFQEYKELDTFKKWLLLEKKLGYDAKGCISPSQVKLVDEIFTHDSYEIEKALYIVENFEKKREQGVTGFSNAKYGFIDEPIYKGALALLGR